MQSFRCGRSLEELNPLPSFLVVSGSSLTFWNISAREYEHLLFILPSYDKLGDLVSYHVTDLRKELRSG